MAVLTSTGITFSDTTSLNSKYGIFPQLAHVVFFQASAPTGWTQVTDHNDVAMRIVSGTGGGTGGSTAFSTIYSDRTLPASTASSHTLSDPQGAAHSHSHQAVFSQPAFTTNQSFNSQAPFGPVRSTVTPIVWGSQGGGGSHTHPVIAGPVNLSIQYINVIICSFN